MINVIEKYGIKLLPVESSDASFIISIRTDKRKSRFISATDENVDSQVSWINQYKTREKLNMEYYFIGVDEENEKFGTYRIYNINDNNAEIGSWVTRPGYKKAQNAIKLDIIIKEFVFEQLGFEQLNFRVNKSNSSVLRYHKMFGPSILQESEEEIFFLLRKDEFYRNRKVLFKNIK
ncbi:GNAT family N-acetyltransferase [Sphingobacterium siyangense]|uniref:GNAT family N-acetyltransferase n=1 Tax=Sphingobacterium siyangense TaxID=459529 RepID=UPI003DA5F489